MPIKDWYARVEDEAEIRRVKRKIKKMFKKYDLFGLIILGFILLLIWCILPS